MTDVISLFYNNQKQTLEIYNSGGEIVSYLSNTNSNICPLLNTTIKFGQELGKGVQGKVFLIFFPNRGQEEYMVAKIVSHQPELETWSQPKATTIPEFAKHEYPYLNVDAFLALNNKKANSKITTGAFIRVPTYANDCSTDKELNFKRHDGNGDTVIPKGSIMCKDEAYSEYLISLLVGSLYEQGTSINFINTFAFATCRYSPTVVAQYTFMQKIDKVLRKMESNLTSEEKEVIILQTLHAIATYSKVFNICHGDLHTSNIFLLEVKDDAGWNGVAFKDVTHFEYVTNGTSFYIPKPKYIVKIGDWGLACKYSQRMVLNKETITTGYNEKDGTGPWLPNFYSEAYDTLFFLMGMADKTIELYNRISTWAQTKSGRRVYGYARTSDNIRPVLSLLDTEGKDITATNILQDKTILGPYAIRPEEAFINDKILAVGKI
jgi:hypothetical protein